MPPPRVRRRRDSSRRRRRPSGSERFAWSSSSIASVSAAIAVGPVSGRRQDALGFVHHPDHRRQQTQLFGKLLVAFRQRHDVVDRALRVLADAGLLPAKHLRFGVVLLLLRRASRAFSVSRVSSRSFISSRKRLHDLQHDLRRQAVAAAARARFAIARRDQFLGPAIQRIRPKLRADQRLPAEIEGDLLAVAGEARTISVFFMSSRIVLNRVSCLRWK